KGTADSAPSGATTSGHAATDAKHGKTPAKGKNAHGHGRTARIMEPAKPCLHDSVRFERGFGGEIEPIVLTRCDNRAVPEAVQALSILARPMNAPRPTQVPTTPVRHTGAQREWLPGVKLVDQGLVVRLQKVVDHFHAAKVTVISGYRPKSLGSFHQSAKAMDFHLDGVSHEAR